MNVSCIILKVPFSSQIGNLHDPYIANVHIMFITEDTLLRFFKEIGSSISQTLQKMFVGTTIILEWNKLEINQKANRCSNRIHLIVNGSGRMLQSYGDLQTVKLDYRKDVAHMSSTEL